MSKHLITPRFFLLVTALSLSLGVSIISIYLVSSPHLDKRVHMHQRVLDGDAHMPYQYDMYLVSKVCQWLQDHAGVTPFRSFALVFGASYVLLFLSTWAYLSQLYRQPASVLIGLFALATYAFLLMPLAYDHPADPFGAALIALALAATARRSPAGILLASLAGGFLWSKHVLVAPIVLLYEGVQARWGRGIGLAALVVAAALIGPLCYRLPLNAVTPEGILTPLEWLRFIPRTAAIHMGFALPPLLSLYLLRSRLDRVVKAGAVLYPLMIALYAAAGFFIYELRSFWPVVPVFVALLAAWGEDANYGNEKLGPADGPRP